MVRKLCEQNAFLKQSEIDYLENMSNSLPIIAELTSSDVFIDVLKKDGKSAIVVSHASPQSAPSLYDNNVAGQTALQKNEPGVIKTLKTGCAIRDIRAITQENKKAEQSVAPIVCNDKVIGALIIEKDITQQVKRDENLDILKKTAAQISQNNANYTSFDLIPEFIEEGLIAFDVDFNAIWHNTATKKILAKDVINKSFEEIFSLDIYTINKNDKNIIRYKDKFLKLNIIRTDQMSTIVVFSDITGQEKTEQQLVNKSLALKEIHHRIKNNLQTIASLLRLQVRHSVNNDVKEALSIAVSRILSTAATHEILSVEGKDQLDLYNLLSQMTHCLSFAISDKDIYIDLTGDHLTIDSIRASDIALVVNELINNSIKHGFKTKKTGNIDIEIIKGETYSSIRVSDNGDGYKKEIEGLGTKIMNAIVTEKLNGKINRTSDDKGTYVIFDFTNNV